MNPRKLVAGGSFSGANCFKDGFCRKCGLAKEVHVKVDYNRKHGAQVCGRHVYCTISEKLVKGVARVDYKCCGVCPRHRKGAANFP